MFQYSRSESWGVEQVAGAFDVVLKTGFSTLGASRGGWNKSGNVVASGLSSGFSTLGASRGGWNFCHVRHAQAGLQGFSTLGASRGGWNHFSHAKAAGVNHRFSTLGASRGGWNHLTQQVNDFLHAFQYSRSESWGVELSDGP